MTAKTVQPAVLNQTDDRIGIALGSGSARGWAHIGVLRALAEMGIYPGVVAGCSIGSLVGAAYASDQLDALEGWVNSLSWKDVLAYLDISLLGGGLIQGEKLMKFAHQYLGELEIQSLPVSFGAVATDLDTGREIWLREGPLLDNIRASIALPRLFPPYKLDERWLMDGGLVDPVPIALCRAMGAEVVIAVNLNGDIVGKHLKQKNRETYRLKKKDLEDADAWTKISNQITNSFDEQKDVFLSKLLGGSKDTPGLFDVMASSINSM